MDGVNALEFFRPAIVLMGLGAALFLEARRGRFPEALPVGLCGVFAVLAAASGGPPEAIRVLAAFAAGTALALPAALSGTLAPRHALVFGMGACALGPEALLTMMVFSASAWGVGLFAGRMEREIRKIRITRALYGSSRFVLAGSGAGELFDDKRRTRLPGAFSSLCLGAALSTVWHVTGHGYFILT